MKVKKKDISWVFALLWCLCCQALLFLFPRKKVIRLRHRRPLEYQWGRSPKALHKWQTRRNVSASTCFKCLQCQWSFWLQIEMNEIHEVCRFAECLWNKSADAFQTKGRPSANMRYNFLSFRMYILQLQWILKGTKWNVTFGIFWSRFTQSTWPREQKTEENPSF